jgi:CDP-6-deoxy-D-xylo-4-hexulose-3-dehydrase
MNNQVIEVKTAEQKQKDQIRQAISKLVDEYAAIEFAYKVFIPGITVIPPSGKLIDAGEIKNMVEASLDAWLTTGHCRW